jgi:hypothetical protein
VARVDAFNLQHSVLTMASNRFRGFMCALSIAWVGIWMPCKVLTWLWRLWPLVGVWEEIIPLCFLVMVSVGLLIRLFRSLV